jgi:adenylate kinase family enzyme
MGSAFDKKQPLFSKDQVLVIFILGRPGTGKGTLSEKLVRRHDFVHLSAGDLLRAEQAREGSEYGALIKKYIQEGEIVPLEITVGLLKNAMSENVENKKNKFLIDGFPRKMDQAFGFEADVSSSLMKSDGRSVRVGLCCILKRLTKLFWKDLWEEVERMIRRKLLRNDFA